MKCFFQFAILFMAMPEMLLAQSSTPSLTSKPFFVEVRNSYNEYVIRYALVGNRAVIRSFPLTVGYYLTPRLAVQLAGAYGSTMSDWPGGTRTTPDGIYTSNVHSEGKHAAIPLLMRYVLNRRLLQSRLQVDALLGGAWAYDSFTYTGQSTFTSTPNGTAILLGGSSRSDHGSQFFITAGLGLRWRFYRNFEAVGEFSWNRNLDGPSPEETMLITGTRYGFTPNNSFGLRYRFNLRKPAPQPAATE